MYLLDTNVFISAKNLYYSFDFHPGFWDWLVHANTEGRVFSIYKVYEEICRQEDQLTGWARDHKEGLFLESPKDFDYHLQCVTGHLKNENHRLSDIDEFSDTADAHLIAYALSNSFKVVTLEGVISRKGRIKIPSVCQKLEVECITPFDMLRQEKARFVWKPDNG